MTKQQTLWIKYMEFIDAENIKIRDYNTKIYKRRDKTLSPIKKKFLFFSWTEYPHYLTVELSESFNRIFIKNNISPSWEDFMSWCIKNNYSL